MNFAKKFKKSKYFKFLVAVPSSYSKTYEKELIKHGFQHSYIRQSYVESVVFIYEHRVAEDNFKK